MTHPDHPERRRGKSKITMVHRWAVAGGANLMHLFWSLSNDPGMAKSMCGYVHITTTGNLHDLRAALGAPVCPRCREVGLPGHPLPRGMA